MPSIQKAACKASTRSTNPNDETTGLWLTCFAGLIPLLAMASWNANSSAEYWCTREGTESVLLAPATT